jgi:hypothetical protein
VRVARAGFRLAVSEISEIHPSLPALTSALFTFTVLRLLGETNPVTVCRLKTRPGVHGCCLRRLRSSLSAFALALLLRHCGAKARSADLAWYRV